MSDQRLETYQKALSLNLDTNHYGTIAEIGAGQEVARWFFTVGGASGTVAKAMSAYDMKISDDVYGHSNRYVSKDRLEAMLDHEYSQMVQRLTPGRGNETSFFAFADTISARNYHGTNTCHGWMGIRFQTGPGLEPNTLILHLNLHDDSNLQQQLAVGVLGVNLIFAATRENDLLTNLMSSLLDDLSLERIDVDYLEATGPDFHSLTPTRLNLGLIQADLCRAILLLPENGAQAPMDILYKRPVVVVRSSLRQNNSSHLQEIIDLACSQLSTETVDSKRGPLALVEISLNNVLASEGFNHDEQLQIVEKLLGNSHGVMVSSFPETYLLAQYLNHFTNEPIRFAMGVSSLMQIFENRFYENLEGGIVEALGRFLSQNVKIFIQAMPSHEVKAFLAVSESESEFWQYPTEGLVTCHDINLNTPTNHLFHYMMEKGILIGLPM